MKGEKGRKGRQGIPLHDLRNVFGGGDGPRRPAAVPIPDAVRKVNNSCANCGGCYAKNRKSCPFCGSAAVVPFITAGRSKGRFE